MSRSDTSTRTRTRTRTLARPHWLIGGGPSVLDLAATLLLSLVAISGLSSSYTGWTFLVVAGIGVLLGAACVHVARALGWPLVAAVLGALVAYFGLGGLLALRSLGDWALFPVPRTLGHLADLAVFGWMDLLTTLPPVAGDGPLLALPWLLGLVAGLVTTALAHRSGHHPPRRPWVAVALPVLAQVALLAVVILLGVRRPPSVLLGAAVFAVLALTWLGVRSQRLTATVRGGEPNLGRAVAAGLMLVCAVALALPFSTQVTSGDERAVARTWVEPPFDIGHYPSPLAGFRRYVDPQGRADDTNVHEETLLQVDGVRPGTRIRFAAMDRYDGLVWSASDGRTRESSFQRVSSTIHNPAEGREVSATVTVGKGWSGVWLPTVGALREVEFEVGDPIGKSESFRYNLESSTAVVPSGLRPGDRYRFTAVETDQQIDATTVGWSGGGPGTDEAGFVAGPAQKWGGRETDPVARVLAAARHLRSQGRYSDGVGRAERHVLAGHGVWRLSDEFVNAAQMVGNDEQYAAVMALVANEIGVPARVVLGAEVPADGTVRGEHVAAWVELRTADGSWRTLPTEEFMSRTPPSEQTPQTETPMTGTVVPPPNPVPPPSDAGEQSDADLKERKSLRREDEDGFALPGWVRVMLGYVGLPLLLVVSVAGALVGAKAVRRRRRRHADSVPARVTGGWRDLVDHARDLGLRVPAESRVTRREQSRAFESGTVTDLARQADEWVFGPQVPEPDQVARFWDDLDTQRRSLSAAAGRRQRWWAAVNPTSLWSR